MKLVVAVIRPERLNEVLEALFRAEVKGLTMMVNSIYNGWRFEDVWFDK